MKLDRFLQLFVVKEKRFFPLFRQSAENILKAADLLLLQTKSADQDDRRVLSLRVKECETAGDRITDRIIDELMDAYVTPFDRDDIHALAESMDSFLDAIRDSSKKIAIYQPKQSKKFVEMAEFIRRDAELIMEITGKFDSLRKDIQEVDALCDAIKDIEHMVDDLYESYMMNLLRYEKDTVEIIRKKNIAQALEDVSDMAKTISGIIRSIAVKMG